VLLEVMGTVTQVPVANADVSLRYDYEGNVPAAQRLPEDQRPNDPWFSEFTDKRGKTTIDVKWTMLDRTIGPVPPAWRDQVTGVKYLVRIEKGDIREIHSLAIKPGATVRGDAFTVRVLGIEPPRYVHAE
jgi:hypothetical protein